MLTPVFSQPIVPFPPTASTQAADVDSQSQVRQYQSMHCCALLKHVFDFQVDMQVDADMGAQQPPEPEAVLELPLPPTVDQQLRVLRVKTIYDAFIISSLRRRISSIDQKNSELEAALAGVRTDGLEMVRRTKDGQIERLQAALAQSEAKCAILQKQSERTDMKVRRRAAEASQLEKELVATQTELQELQAENETLKDQLTTEWLVCQDAQDGTPCNSRFRDQEVNDLAARPLKLSTEVCCTGCSRTHFRSPLPTPEEVCPACLILLTQTHYLDIEMYTMYTHVTHAF